MEFILQGYKIDYGHILCIDFILTDLSIFSYILYTDC